MSTEPVVVVLHNENRPSPEALAPVTERADVRFTEADAPRPFRSPLAIGRVPVLAVLGLLAALAMVPGRGPSSTGTITLPFATTGEV